MPIVSEFKAENNLVTNAYRVRIGLCVSKQDILGSGEHSVLWIIMKGVELFDCNSGTRVKFVWQIGQDISCVYMNTFFYMGYFSAKQRDNNHNHIGLLS